jgi:hypothetical protein
METSNDAELGAMPPASSQSTTNDEHVTRAVQPPKNDELDDEAGTGGAEDAPLLRTKYENNSGLDELGRNQALNGASREIVEEIVRSWTRALLQGDLILSLGTYFSGYITWAI